MFCVSTCLPKKFGSVGQNKQILGETILVFQATRRALLHLQAAHQKLMDTWPPAPMN